MPPPEKDPLDESGTDPADARVARFLASDPAGLAKERRKVLAEGGDDAHDVLGRLNALEFMGSIVGETPDMPESLGDYRITGLLGRGGMGTVYEAFQKSLEREVAIKVLSPTFSANLTMRKRFRAEAKLTASLHHQHIVPIYDYGENSGYLFFAMEKVDGISLDKHISAARRRGQPFYEPREAARRFAGVADALGHAHKRRLLHRDVKPGNILVAIDGTLALADFGLSKVLGGAAGEGSRLTTQGGFLGTLHYASPEQALGQELTPSSDLYALGVTLFEAISGELPRQGQNTEALLNAILKEEPRRLRQVVPDAPKDLEAVLHKVLSRDPAERYPDGVSLAADLRRVADGDPVQIRKQPLWQRLRRRAKRNPGMAAATVVAAVLLVVASALLLGMVEARRESRASQREVLLADANTHARVDPGDAVGRVDRFVALTGFPSVARRAVPRALEDLDRAAALDPADPRPAAMRAAYDEDPVPEATGLLVEGWGWEIEKAIQPVIADTFDRSSRGDRAAELQLFQLYMTRAVARLTESVGDADGARTDLVLAGFLRPGAFQAKALALVAALGDGDDVAEVVERAGALVRNAPPGGVEAVGQLLVTASGLVRHERANMLRLALTHSERVAILRAGEALCGESFTVVASAVATGLEQRLASLVQMAVEAAARDDAGALSVLLERTHQLIEQAAATDAPMRRWGVVCQLLRDPSGARSVLDARGQVATPAMILAAYDALLDLAPSKEFLSRLLPGAVGLCSQNAEEPLAARVNARVHHAMAGPDNHDSAFTAASAWIVAAPDDPVPLLARCELGLMSGDVERAIDDASRAVQLAPRRRDVIRRLLVLFASALESSDAASPDSHRLRAAVAAFEEFVS